MLELNTIYQGDTLDVLKTFPRETVQCVVTSPPYWGLRNYGIEGQLGLEKTPEEYVEKLTEIFREVKRVLREDGTCWLNLGDSYCGTGGKGKHRDTKYSEGRNSQETSISKRIAGLKQKDLVGIPWRVAFALQADGWHLRQDIIWHKPNPMPESVKDRCTKAHEYIFLLTKAPKYYFDHYSIQEKSVSNDGRKPYARGQVDNRGDGHDRGGGGELRTNRNQNARWCTEMRNKRSVWGITLRCFKGAHFATFPPQLPTLCIKAGTKEGDIVLDPFMGAGTVGVVAKELKRNYIGIELNPTYIEMANKRIGETEVLLV